MKLTVTKTGTALEVNIAERLDTTTAPQLEKEVGAQLDGVTALTLDFKDLSYVSSAGLRALLGFQKVMNKQGSMVIRNVNENIMEVLEITGFVDILTIE